VEIGRFLRSRPRLSALALLFPVLAALIAAGFLMGRSATYTGSATVSVLGSAANSASRVGLFVADFSTLAASAPVLEEVANKTGQGVDQISSGLEVARIGQSSLFQVSYTGDRRSAVEPVLRETVTRTLGRLADVGNADSAFKAANAAYDEAVAARAAYQDEIGTLQPSQVYADLSARILALQTSPDATSNSSAQALTSQRAGLVPEIRHMEELDRAVQDAANLRQNAQLTAAAIRSDAAQAASKAAIQDLSVTQNSKIGPVAQGAGVAAVGGLLAGIGFLVLAVVKQWQDPVIGSPRHGGSSSEGTTARVGDI